MSQKARSALEMTDKETQRYQVTPHDMDPQYRLTQNSALSYMQDCFARYLARYRSAAYDLKEEGRMWVISDTVVRFVPEKVAYWTDTVECELWLSELTNVRAYTDFRLTNHRGEVFAEGSCQWNIINAETRRIERCNERLKEMPLRDEMVLGDHKRLTLPAGDTEVRRREHSVNATEIDQNMHLNNRAYIDIAMAALAGEELRGKATDMMYVKFVREAFLGDKLTSIVSRASEDEGAYHCSIRNDQDEEVCHVYTHWTEGDTMDVKDYYDRYRADGRKPLE